MAKLKKNEKHVHSVSVKKKVDSTPKWAIPFILILTLMAYLPALKAGFVNWDDSDYVLGNLLIRDFSNFSALITTPVQGNYHPLTMISLAINYQISGLNAWSYHLFNLIFHLINCFLVFRLARLLSNQNFIIAFTTSIFFAVHPMHVESVAWISERKDVLYTLFFLAGLYSYTKFVDTNSIKQFGLAVLFLILSLLSKPAAVVFPLVLICIDLLRKRQITLKLFLEKIPFLIPVLVIGLMTYLAQTSVGATGSAIFPLSSRILFGTYGIMMYLIKLFIPFNLSPFYPYPPINQSLPLEYLISPLFFVALSIIFYFSMNKYRAIAFGISFYLANLVLVLQILPVGSAVISDRYTYVPYIGIFYVLGWFVDKLKNTTQRSALFMIIPVAVLFSGFTYQQVGIWKDGAALWDHVIETNPNSRAYATRASLLRKENKLDKALDYCNKAISMNSIDPQSYSTRGNIYSDLKKNELALADFRKSLSLKPDSYGVLDNIGTLFAIQEKYDSALYYLDKAIRIKPDYGPTYRNRGLAYLHLNKTDDAIKDFGKFLTFEPNDSDILNAIGHCLRLQKKFSESIINIDKAIHIKAHPSFYLNRSYAYYGLNSLELAKKDALVAKESGILIDPGYAKNLGLE